MLGVILVLAVVLLLLAGAPASGDVWGNVGPAPQIPPGGLYGRYPLGAYQLDQYFPALSVGLFSGVDASGLLPMIAFFIAQVIWQLTAFVSNAVIGLFGLAFSLDLVSGNGAPGSGALAPVSQAIHNIYTSTFGQPWLIAAIAATSLWAMWKALIQRRYSETVGALAVSLVNCVIALAIVTNPQATIAPASRLANEAATGLLSLTGEGNLTSEAAAKQAAGDQLFRLLISQPWTVLEFGGVEHCTEQVAGKAVSVPVRPLGGNASEETALSDRLQSSTEVRTQGGKTCINDELKYAPHFLRYPPGTIPGAKEREQEYEALRHGSDSKLPESDPGRHDESYPLGPADQPAAEASGKGGQYERLLLAPLILLGSLGAWALLGALALGLIVASLFLLLYLCLAPFALAIGVIPGRGHDFFRAWLSRLAGFLLRKVIYAAILAVVLAVCGALADATSNLGWLGAFALQTLFLWAVFLQRNRIAGDFLAATAGPHAAREDGVSRLQTTYYAVRLLRMAGLHRPHTGAPLAQGHGPDTAVPPTPSPESSPPRGIEVPEPGEDSGEPVWSTEGGDIPPAALEPDPDEEPS